MSNKERSFKFYVPLELLKSEQPKEEDDPTSWQIQGIASTPDEDIQGETIDQDGLDISLLKAGRGLFNLDHSNKPEDILGEIEDADFIKKDGKKCLFVKGYLFKHQERSKAFYNILKSLKKSSAGRVQLSIEGKVLARDFADNKAIKKARVDKVAITLNPVNPYTYAELVKSLNTPEPEPQIEIVQENEQITINKSELQKLVDIAQKALAAGIGHASAPQQRTGGEATAFESLESQVKPVNRKIKDKKQRRTMLKSLLESLKKAHPNEDPMQLAEWVIESFMDKIEGNKGE